MRIKNGGTMNELIDAISKIEWDMFHSTKNVGGPAWCQQDYNSFLVMRTSQLGGWNEASLESYLEDLKAAEANGENLMTLKYAYMMESTSPLEFAAIADRLPAVDGEKKALVEKLTAQTVKWADEFHNSYPLIGRASRPVHKEADNLYTTSAETYQRGETSTYSLKTLRLLSDHYDDCEKRGVNLYTEILKDTVSQLGYSSLDAAEEQMRRQRG